MGRQKERDWNVREREREIKRDRESPYRRREIEN